MANLKDLIVNGVSRFIGKVYINDSKIEVINNSTVGDNPKFTDTTYAAVGTSGNAGLMSTADKVKLDTIATSATRNTFSAFTGAPTSNQTPGFGSTFNIYQVGQTTAGAITTTARTVKIPDTDATTSAHGLLTATDKIKLNALTTADATTSAHGYLTAADKIKLNALSTVDNNTTYGLVTTAANGLAPKLSNSASQYLNGLGSWTTPTNTTYAAATTSAAGLMTADDKKKLNSIASSATRNTFSAFTGAPTSNQTPGFGSTFNIYQVGQTTAGAITTTARTVKIPNTAATTAAAGLMSAADKIKLDNCSTGSSYQYIADGTCQSVLLSNISKNKATGRYSVAEGNATTASGENSHAEGTGTIASTQAAHAEGYQTIASGEAAHAEGINTFAEGNYSHAEGNGSYADGIGSHAEGEGSYAVWDYAHAEGSNTTANSYAHAEGIQTSADASPSHAEGIATTATGQASHTEGYYTEADGDYSHSEGYYTLASFKSQHVFGECNIADPSTVQWNQRGTYIEIVGNGTTATRNNARTLDWNGNERLTGSLIAKNTVLGIGMYARKIGASITDLSGDDITGGLHTVRDTNNGDYFGTVSLYNISTVQNASPQALARFSKITYSNSYGTLVDNQPTVILYQDGGPTGSWLSSNRGFISNGSFSGFMVYGKTPQHSYNMDWTSSGLIMYVDTTNVGKVTLTSSDARVKTDINPLGEQYKKAISSLDFKEFKYNFKDSVRSEANGLKRFGVIAQDVIAALEKQGLDWKQSEIVETTENENDTYYTINYVPFLVTRLAADEDRIKQLEETVKNLTTRLEALEQK